MQKSFIKFLIISIILFQGFSVFAQDNRELSDLQLIDKVVLSSNRKDVHRSFVNSGETSVAKKMNPLRFSYGVALYVYQNGISRHISADCLYTPSCSEYSKIAIRETGLLHGLVLTLDRINRCNVISAQDLKHYERDPRTGRYPDPVSRHLKSAWYVEK
jgi:uncharacterized protein